MIDLGCKEAVHIESGALPQCTYTNVYTNYVAFLEGVPELLKPSHIDINEALALSKFKFGDIRISFAPTTDEFGSASVTCNTVKFVKTIIATVSQSFIGADSDLYNAITLRPDVFASAFAKTISAFFGGGITVSNVKFTWVIKPLTPARKLSTAQEYDLLVTYDIKAKSSSTDAGKDKIEHSIDKLTSLSVTGDFVTSVVSNLDDQEDAAAFSKIVADAPVSLGLTVIDQDEKEKDVTDGEVAAIVILSFVGVAALIYFLIAFYRKRKNAHDGYNNEDIVTTEFDVEPVQVEDNL